MQVHNFLAQNLSFTSHESATQHLYNEWISLYSNQKAASVIGIWFNICCHSIPVTLWRTWISVLRPPGWNYVQQYQSKGWKRNLITCCGRQTQIAKKLNSLHATVDKHSAYIENLHLKFFNYLPPSPSSVTPRINRRRHWALRFSFSKTSA